MTDRTQTLSVELERGHVEKLARNETTGTLMYDLCEAARLALSEPEEGHAVPGAEERAPYEEDLSQPEHQGDEEPIEVRFQGGPLDGKTRRMVGVIDLHVVAWKHRQAGGIVDVALPSDRPRQADLWEQFDYGLAGSGPGWANVTLLDLGRPVPLSTQPPAPVLSDKERRRLKQIADDYTANGTMDSSDATFLRNLASQEHGKSIKTFNAASQEHRGEESGCDCKAMITDSGHCDGCGQRLYPPLGLRALDPQPPAGEVEGLRERLEYRVNAHDGIFGPFPDIQAALLELGEHQQSWEAGSSPRPPELESRWVGPWTEGRLDVSPPSHSQGDQERCKRCGDAKVINRVFANGAILIDCPDCNPAPTKEPCERCGDTGIDPSGATPGASCVLCEGNPAPTQADCERCQGEGWVGVFSVPATCPRCNGTGKKQPEGDAPRCTCGRNVEAGFHAAACPLGALDRGQPEGGDEEDWPAFIVQRFERDDPIRPYRYVVLDGTQSTDFTNCREYLPATSQDSSGLLGCTHSRHQPDCAFCRSHEAWLKERDRANKAEAERDRFEKLATERLERLRDTEKASDLRCVAAQRAETALEELVSELEAEAHTTLPGAARNAVEQIASLVREKAAKLKGERDGERG